MLRCIVRLEQSNSLAIRSNVILLPISFISNIHSYISSALTDFDLPINLPTIFSLSSVDNIQCQLNITLRILFLGGSSRSIMLTSYIIFFSNCGGTANVIKPFDLSTINSHKLVKSSGSSCGFKYHNTSMCHLSDL